MILAAALVVAAFLLWRSAAPAGDVWIWAWERPEDLRFIDPARVGVAFLASTIIVENASIRFNQRRQPLRVPPGARLIAVVRIEPREIDPGGLPDPAPVAQGILDAAALPHVTGLQIDFDATASQRAWYRELLGRVRARSSPDRKLSITALASWCLDDPWISGLPVDEAVPMLFRMGLDERTIRARLAAGGDFTLEMCRKSIGVSTDEHVYRPARGRRIWIFHQRPWTSADLAATLERVR
jgi:hypothetical protein